MIGVQALQFLLNGNLVWWCCMVQLYALCTFIIYLSLTCQHVVNFFPFFYTNAHVTVPWIKGL